MLSGKKLPLLLESSLAQRDQTKIHFSLDDLPSASQEQDIELIELDSKVSEEAPSSQDEEDFEVVISV